MMHVGFLIAGDIDGGSGGFYYDRRLRDRLQARGHEVTIVSLPWRSYGGQLLENIPSVPRVRSRRFDLLLEDGLAHPSLLLLNRLTDRPIVALLHMLRWKASDRPYRPLVRAVERRFLSGVDAAIYNSEATRRDADSIAAPKHGTVIPPAGDRFDPDVTPGEIRDRATEKPLEILFLGTPTPRKGLDTLVEGLERVGAEWRLTVVGETTTDPEYVASVRRLTRRAGIADRIRFTGRVSDSAVEDRLRRAHVLAIPSRYEPFGMAYLESMGFGCVPIATSNGGPSEFIEDGESGFLVPPDNPAAVADRIDRLADSDRLAAFGVAARNAFETHPTWTETLDHAVDFLEARCPTT